MMKLYSTIFLTSLSLSVQAAQWEVVKDYDFSGTSVSSNYIAFITEDKKYSGGVVRNLRASFVCNKYSGDYIRFTKIHSKTKDGVIYWKTKEDEKWNISEAYFDRPMVVINSKKVGYEDLLSAMKTSKNILISLDRVETSKVNLNGFTSSYLEVRNLSNCKS